MRRRCLSLLLMAMTSNPRCCHRAFFSCPGALQIELSEESDQGKYECVATNNDGTRYSAPANLYVRGMSREVLLGICTVRKESLETFRICQIDKKKAYS